MDWSKPYTRGIIRYDIKSKLKASGSAHRLNWALGKKNVSECMAQILISWICTRDHDVEDRPWPGRSSGLDDKLLRHLAMDDPQQKTCYFVKAWLNRYLL